MTTTGFTRRRIVWTAIVVALATIIAYAPALSAPFLFDDGDAIVGNVSIRQLWPPSVPLEPPPQLAVSGRPIVNYTLALNYAANTLLGVDQRPDPEGPYKTIGYHIVNLLLHLTCGVLLFGIIRRTARRLKTRTDGTDPEPALTALDPDGLALVVTALWLVHPIQTEAVNYLIQRTELLVSACYLGTLYASIRAWDATASRARLGWYAAAIVICLAGMGSKEVMITAPLAVALYDRAFRLGSWRQLLSQREGRPWFYALLCATSLWLIALMAGGPRSATVGFHVGMPWYAYFYSQAWAILHYIRLVIWPSALTLDYGGRAVQGLGGVLGLVVLGAFFVATIVAWTRVERWGWFGFLGAWFFMLLGPSSSVVPINTEIAAERRIYLALASVLVLIVIGVQALWRRATNPTGRSTPTRGFGTPRTLQFAFGAVGLLLAATTFERSRTYSTVESMWRDVTQKSPDNPRGYDNLGTILLVQKPPRVAEAESLFRRAASLDSTDVIALFNLSEVAMSRGQLADARALLQRVVTLDPTHVKALDRYGSLLAEQGDPEHAIPYLERAAATSRDEQPFVDLGMVYAAVGRPADAITALQRAIALDPSRADARRYLGAVLLEANRPADAEQYLMQAVRISPNDPAALTMLGEDEAALGKRGDAAELFRHALAVRPDYTPARQALDRLAR